MTRPQLAIVVDTEEEFDWTRPFDRASTGTSSIPAQARAHQIYDALGVVPTYVIDYPVATDPAAIAFLRTLREEGRAEIGTHLHPWVSPPHAEEVTTHNSYHCNLPPDLERAKIETLTAAIASAFGAAPTVFKAGRYGFGPNTAHVLKDLGYTIDCSYVPHVSFRSDGGPDYRGTPDQPFFLDADKTLLEVPLTSGFYGALSALAPRAAGLFDSPTAARLRLPGILSRLSLATRSRLTPEGVPADEQCRLLDAMVASGRTFFTLTYHSPSLAPGHTPYVRSEADLTRFLGTIEQVLRHFRDRLGGEFTTLTRYAAGA
ncbi:MAG TPA: polysaccharide deacetylase family protein [Allosphingosinicella sp.]|jgi:hypothetical protein